MSPLGLLALTFAVVSIGGSAVVYVYDRLEARLLGERPGGDGGRSSFAPRARRSAAVGAARLPRGVVVTARAGARPAVRGEPSCAVTEVRGLHVNRH